MRSTELRIGNWVHGKYSTPKLFQWESDDFDFYKHRMDDIEPIPLTEEWLVRFGFKKTHSELTYKEYDYKKFGAEINSDIMTVSYNYGNDVEWVNFTHIKHVHTLQNLYHALTGEELELKP